MNIYRTLILAALHSICAFNALGGAFDPNLRWPKTSVKVCFGNTETLGEINGFWADALRRAEARQASAEHERVVREIIEREYTLPSTGITFVGWESCARSEDYDIGIIVVGSWREGMARAEDPGHRIFLAKPSAAIGNSQTHLNREEFRQRPGQREFVYLPVRPATRVFSELNSLRLDALHEMGHLAGLWHEHARADARLDETCGLSERDRNEILPRTTNAHGRYDSQSVMNYCQNRRLRFRTGLPEGDQPTLSRGDRASLRALYR